MLETLEVPDDPVDEPMYTRANVQPTFDRFNHSRRLSNDEDDMF